jgi:hypothetical protein
MSVTQTTHVSFSDRSTVVTCAARNDRRTNGAPVVAERVGFEPTDRITAINALAGRPIRPLWHLSWEPRSVAR